MTKRKHLAAIGAVLFALGREAIDPALVDAYIVVGGQSIGTMTIRQIQTAVRIAVNSIDLDSAAARVRVRELAAKDLDRKDSPL